MIALACVLLAAGLARAEGGTIELVNPVVERADDDRWRLSAAFDIRLGEVVREALLSGVALTFDFVVELRHTDGWPWRRSVTELRQRRELVYLALASAFRVERLDSGAVTEYTNMSAALADIGRLEALPVIAASELEAGKDHVIRLDASLDIEALPVPLRPRAYLSTDWYLSSPEYEIPLP